MFFDKSSDFPNNLVTVSPILILKSKLKKCLYTYIYIRANGKSLFFRSCFFSFDSYVDTWLQNDGREQTKNMLVDYGYVGKKSSNNMDFFGVGGKRRKGK